MESDFADWWDMLGTAIAGLVLGFMVYALLQQCRGFGLRQKWLAIVVDCLVVLLCMWAIWWIGLDIG